MHRNSLFFQPIFLLAILVGLGACTSSSTRVDKQGQTPNLILEATDFESLPAWEREDYKYFGRAFSKSCDPIKKKTAAHFKQGQQWGDITKWQKLCADFDSIQPEGYKAFFETNFVPHIVKNGSDSNGLFTGYYESSLNGARVKGGKYQYPLYKRPDDLVMVQLGDFRDDLKGRRIAGRVSDGRLRPYESRADIVAGEIGATPIVWLDDPVDAFFVQVQGSGVVSLNDGGVMRIGYAGQNGHPYHAIGRTLIERGELNKETVSLQTIRHWLIHNPDDAADVMNTNASYVFFRELDGDGPVGGQGVSLTQTRSLAIDHTQIPYGIPLWVDIEYPKENYANIRRLMVAQDTGGAIRGPVRGDFFWGHGDFAQNTAGVMKSNGRYWALLPR